MKDNITIVYYIYICIHIYIYIVFVPRQLLKRSCSAPALLTGFARPCSLSAFWRPWQRDVTEGAVRKEMGCEPLSLLLSVGYMSTLLFEIQPQP